MDATGLVGPAEVPTKRNYTFVDIQRTTRALGLRLTGPPVHPFLSLKALRLVTVELREPHALRLAIALASACWEEGLALTDVSVLEEVAAGVGIDTGDLLGRINAPEVKAALRTTTESALAAGVFGVPTFAYRPELFWGHDRMQQLAEMLRSGRDPLTTEAGRLLGRPRGTDRRSRR